MRSNRVADGLEEYRRAIDVFGRLARDHPTVPDYACRQGNSLTNRADLLREMGRFDDALESMKQSQVVIDKVIQSYPDVPIYQGMSADVAINTAAVLYEMGRRGEAKTAYQQALVQHIRLPNKSAVDQFNIACLHGRVAAFIVAEGDGATPAQRAEVARHLDQAMAALFAAAEAGYRKPSKYAADPDLELLRSRADFQRLLMDLAFPGDPFAK